MKSKEQELFELIEFKGETLEGELHILDNSDSIYEEEKEYRVYHAEGYCFDVSKEIETEDEDTGEVLTYSYSVYSSWDGFKELTVDKAIKLVSSK